MAWHRLAFLCNVVSIIDEENMKAGLELFLSYGSPETGCWPSQRLQRLCAWIDFNPCDPEHNMWVRKWMDEKCLEPRGFSPKRKNICRNPEVLACVWLSVGMQRTIRPGFFRVWDSHQRQLGKRPLLSFTCLVSVYSWMPMGSRLCYLIP